MANTAIKNLSTEDICEGFKQGFSVRELAAMFNCSENSIRHHLKKGGLWKTKTKKEKDMTSGRKNLQRDLVNHIMESKDEIFTIESVAKEFDSKLQGDKTMAASRLLSAIAKKGLGLVRVSRGSYKRTSPPKLLKEPVAQPQKVETPAPQVVNNCSALPSLVRLIQKSAQSIKNETSSSSTVHNYANMIEEIVKLIENEIK